jgi:Rnl2 family RNA ligase
MDFEKYGKTRSGADSRYIVKNIKADPELATCEYVATEKLDGTNFTIFIDELGTVRQGSRNQEITGTMTHFDCHNAVLKQYEEEISKLSAFAIENKSTVRIHGELYGQGILPRIDYGPKKFLPFQLKINGIMLSPFTARTLIRQVVGHDWWVPIINVFKSLKEALEYDVDSYEHHEGRDIEGVVIEPWSYVSTLGKFKLKLKTKAFCDLESVKQKKVKQKAPVSKEAEELAEVYFGYFNKNRMLDLESKKGRIEEPQQIGEYLKELVSDAKEDFLEVHKEGFILLTDAEKKYILHVGTKAASATVKQSLFS